MRLLPPGEESPLLNNSSEMPTLEAYILVLTFGDLAQYKNSKGEDVNQNCQCQIRLL